MDFSKETVVVVEKLAITDVVVDSEASVSVLEAVSLSVVIGSTLVVLVVYTVPATENNGLVALSTVEVSLATADVAAVYAVMVYVISTTVE